MALSKDKVEALLREGSAFTEEVDASELEDGATLNVRPLTRAEVSKVNIKASAGQQLSTGVGDGKKSMSVDGLRIDLEKATKAAEEAEAMTVAFGLSTGDDEWHPTDVGALPPRLFRRVIRKVRELTDDEELLESADSFRDRARREDASD